MNKQEFQEELFKNLKKLNDSQAGEIISILVDELPYTSYERLLCKIKNKNGTLKPNKEKFDKIQEEIQEGYKQIDSGEICFNCYSYSNDSYSYYEEDYDIYYYSNEEIDEVLDKTYEFGKTLIYHKEYAKAIEMFDLILFTNYSCEEVGNPEYDDSGDVYATFEVDITNLKDSLDFDLDYACLYGIYAVLASNYPNKCKKIYTYLKRCRGFNLEDALDLGIEPITNIEKFKNEYQTYLNKNNLK